MPTCRCRQSTKLPWEWSVQSVNHPHVVLQIDSACYSLLPTVKIPISAS